MMSDAGEGLVRLQKLLARAGVASRRKCEALILDGRISVNGHVVTELGTKVDPQCDKVAFDGRPVALSVQGERVVIALNKPAGYLTAMSDSRGERVVSSLVPVSEHKGLFPIGRLDRDTTGLLLFTTDGELGNALLHPSKEVVKRYVALIEGELSPKDIAALESGVELDDGMTSPAKCQVLGRKGRAARGQRGQRDLGAQRTGDSGNKVAGRAACKAADKAAGRAAGKAAGVVLQRVALEIHEGRKRQVRRMFSCVGHEVMSLERTKFGPIELAGLPQGSWRRLEASELSSLYAACGLE